MTQTPVGEAGSDGLPALLPWGVCGGAATPPRDAIKTRVSGNAGIAAAGQEGQAPGPKQAQAGVTAGQQPWELGSSWTHPEDELQLLLPGVRMHFALKPHKRQSVPRRNEQSFLLCHLNKPRLEKSPCCICFLAPGRWHTWLQQKS